jgi:hypothetical protein
MVRRADVESAGEMKVTKTTGSAKSGQNKQRTPKSQVIVFKRHQG